MKLRDLPRIWLVVSAVVALVATSGCAGEQLSKSDAHVISQLTEIAPEDAQIDGDVTSVECWKPSENMLDETQFRVLCRLFYEQDAADRYYDAICVGDVTADPVTDYCYYWAYYTDIPQFEDQPGFASS